MEDLDMQHPHISELTNETEIASEIIAMIEVDIIRNWNILPVDFENGTLEIYASQKKTLLKGSMLLNLLQKRKDSIKKLNIRLCSQDTLNLLINKYYKTSTVIKNERIVTEEDNTRIAQMFRDICSKARELKASDIHITPNSSGASVQYRVDDNLIYSETQINLDDRDQLVNYIKIEANLETTVKNRSQNGVIDKGDIEYRVGTYPNGRDLCNSVVIRLQDKNVKYIRLDEMGFEPGDLATLKDICKYPDGITMLVGPTGQGKSTTMNGLIREFPPAQYAIFSIEDPIEQQIEGASQANVIGGINAAEVFGMENAVEAILRLDPDIAYIGEIRSAKTAHAVAQLAQTGHLAFTTLHAKDCAESIVRLKGLNVNIADFLRSVNCIGAQRLIGLNCPHCKTKIVSTLNDVLSPKELELLPEGGYTFKSIGCEKCHNTGVLGRKPLLELLVLNNEMRDFFSQEPGLVETINYLKSQNFVSMWDKGVRLLAKGEISLENLWSTVRPL